MTTDNTQDLDEILEDFYDGDIRQSDMGKAKQAILQWVSETKSVKAVKYMLSVWDEVLPDNWRDTPDHVQKKFLEAEAEQREILRKEGLKNEYTQD